VIHLSQLLLWYYNYFIVYLLILAKQWSLIDPFSLIREVMRFLLSALFTPAANVNDWDREYARGIGLLRFVWPVSLTHTHVRATGVYRRGARSASLRSRSKNFSAFLCRFTSVVYQYCSRDEPEAIGHQNRSIREEENSTAKLNRRYGEYWRSDKFCAIRYHLADIVEDTFLLTRWPWKMRMVSDFFDF